MENQDVYLEEQELERMCVQERVLGEYEKEMFRDAAAGRENLVALDVGCSNGWKTVTRFADPAFARVIGLEYHRELAQRAQARFGNEKFSFRTCDAEQENFPSVLRSVADEIGTDGFDVIYLSCLLMNVSDPRRLLQRLRPFLRPDGRLIIVEPWDEKSVLSDDPEGLLGEYLARLREDPYAGNRRLGGELCQMLEECGYTVRHWQDKACAGAGETQKKQDIYTIYYSFFPEDVDLLREQEPENEIYGGWKTWMDENYSKLREKILTEDSYVSIGMHFITSHRNERTDIP